MKIRVEEETLPEIKEGTEKLFERILKLIENHAAEEIAGGVKDVVVFNAIMSSLVAHVSKLIVASDDMGILGKVVMTLCMSVEANTSHDCAKEGCNVTRH